MTDLATRFPLFLTSLACLAFAGGGCSQRNAQRLPTFRVSGQILVNGQPEKELVLQLVPEPDDPLFKTRLRPGAVTDESGRFQVTTYSVGDGAPRGRYRMVVFWPPSASGAPDLSSLSNQPPSSQPSQLQKDAGPPDRFGGKFFNADQSQFKLTVLDQAIEMPVINLE